jgi:hypothetical protein
MPNDRSSNARAWRVLRDEIQQICSQWRVITGGLLPHSGHAVQRRDPVDISGLPLPPRLFLIDDVGSYPKSMDVVASGQNLRALSAVWMLRQTLCRLRGVAV